MSFVSGPVQGALGAEAAKDAAGKQAAASKAATDLQFIQWMYAANEMKPFTAIELERAGISRDAMQEFGQAIGDMPPPPEWEGSDYQKAMQSGLEFAAREAGAQGTARGGGRGKIGSDVYTAGTEYLTRALPALKQQQQQFYQQEQNFKLNPLRQLAGMAQAPTAAGMTGTMGANIAGSIAEGMRYGGAAQASGILGANQAWQTGMNQAMQLPQQIGTQMLMNKLFPSGGSGSGFSMQPAGYGFGFGGGGVPK